MMKFPIKAGAIVFAGCLLLTGCSDTASESGSQTGANAANAAPTHDHDGHAEHAAVSGAEGELCQAHGDPAALCFICDPSLRDEGRLWCREHGRYEDRCWLCHPELEDKNRLYCKEHFLYEDECFLCHPEIEPPAKTVKGAANTPSPNNTAQAANANRLWCNEHSVYEDECGICHPELAGKSSSDSSLKIRFASPEAATKAGVQTGRPNPGHVDSSVECFAELKFNQNRLADITPLVGGIIRAVEVDLGAKVREGDLLGTIASLEIADAQGRYIRSLAHEQLSAKNLEREQELQREEIASVKELQHAEADFESAQAETEAARQHLLTLGFSVEQIQSIADNRSASGLMEIRAPFTGEVVERNAVQGAMAQSGEPLFKIADRSVMWAMLTIPESQLAKVQTGQQVHLRMSASPDEIFTGTLTWIGAEVNHRTRMATARAEVNNADGRLKANMFVRAEILLNQPEPSLVLPDSAIQYLDSRPYAFVREGEDLFGVRPLELGPQKDGLCVVRSGLKAEDNVVMKGSFAVKSQLLLSRLGAGCVHD